ncbi:MAG: carbamoyl-phosphate synthase domain-containing protein, partial [Prevotella sp.]
NFRSEKTLDEALKDFGIPGIYGIDTRALTRKLRSKGVKQIFLSKQRNKTL